MAKVDIKKCGYYGYADVLTGKNVEERKAKYKKQRKERGFDDTELWNLDETMAAFMLPRLKRFKKITHSYPPDLTPEQWDKKLDKMIEAFELICDSKWETIQELRKEEKIIKKGLKVFFKYYRDLWD